MKLFFELNRMHRSGFPASIKVLHLCCEMAYYNMNWETAKSIIFAGVAMAPTTPKRLTGSRQRAFKRAELAG